MELDLQLKKLTQMTERLLDGCKKTAVDGTVLFTPDGVGNYDALWVRDFGYMVEYCHDLMCTEEIGRCIEFIMKAQRDDGWFPDRVEASGKAVYAAGAKDRPVGLANLDNAPFLVFSVFEYLKLIEKQVAQRKFLQWKDKLSRGLLCIPLSRDGLVYNDSSAPHSPYGFTDTVCKTGSLFIESLLFWRACRQMEEMYTVLANRSDDASLFGLKAKKIECAVTGLFEKKSGMFFAADGLCRQLDIWGAAYMLYIDFPVSEEIKSCVENWLIENREKYSYKGQICQLPGGIPWERLLIDIPAGEYQNGAYWATAGGWVWYLFARLRPQIAGKILLEIIDNFENDGIYECINKNYHKLPEFVVSATNVRGAVLRFCKENGKLYK